MTRGRSFRIVHKRTPLALPGSTNRTNRAIRVHLSLLQVTIFRMKAKKHYRRTNGHRQPLSKILITKIAA